MPRRFPAEAGRPRGGTTEEGEGHFTKLIVDEDLVVGGDITLGKLVGSTKLTSVKKEQNSNEER